MQDLDNIPTEHRAHVLAALDTIDPARAAGRAQERTLEAQAASVTAMVEVSRALNEAAAKMNSTRNPSIRELALFAPRSLALDSAARHSQTTLNTWERRWVSFAEQYTCIDSAEVLESVLMVTLHEQGHGSKQQLLRDAPRRFAHGSPALGADPDTVDELAVDVFDFAAYMHFAARVLYPASFDAALVEFACTFHRDASHTVQAFADRWVDGLDRRLHDVHHTPAAAAEWMRNSGVELFLRSSVGVRRTGACTALIRRIADAMVQQWASVSSFSDLMVQLKTILPTHVGQLDNALRGKPILARSSGKGVPTAPAARDAKWVAITQAFELDITAFQDAPPRAPATRARTTPAPPKPKPEGKSAAHAAASATTAAATAAAAASASAGRTRGPWRAGVNGNCHRCGGEHWNADCPQSHPGKRDGSGTARQRTSQAKSAPAPAVTEIASGRVHFTGADTGLTDEELQRIIYDVLPTRVDTTPAEGVTEASAQCLEEADTKVNDSSTYASSVSPVTAATTVANVEAEPSGQDAPLSVRSAVADELVVLARLDVRPPQATYRRGDPRPRFVANSMLLVDTGSRHTILRRSALPPAMREAVLLPLPSELQLRDCNGRLLGLFGMMDCYLTLNTATAVKTRVFVADDNFPALGIIGRWDMRAVGTEISLKRDRLRFDNGTYAPILYDPPVPRGQSHAVRLTVHDDEPLPPRSSVVLCVWAPKFIDDRVWHFTQSTRYGAGSTDQRRMDITFAMPQRCVMGGPNYVVATNMSDNPAMIQKGTVIGTAAPSTTTVVHSSLVARLTSAMADHYETGVTVARPETPPVEDRRALLERLLEDSLAGVPLEHRTRLLDGLTPYIKVFQPPAGEMIDVSPQRLPLKERVRDGDFWVRVWRATNTFIALKTPTVNIDAKTLDSTMLVQCHNASKADRMHPFSVTVCKFIRSIRVVE